MEDGLNMIDEKDALDPEWDRLCLEHEAETEREGAEFYNFGWGNSRGASAPKRAECT
jgi:hypothetical protein